MKTSANQIFMATCNMLSGLYAREDYDVTEQDISKAINLVKLIASKIEDVEDLLTDDESVKKVIKTVFSELGREYLQATLLTETIRKKYGVGNNNASAIVQKAVNIGVVKEAKKWNRKVYGLSDSEDIIKTDSEISQF